MQKLGVWLSSTMISIGFMELTSPLLHQHILLPPLPSPPHIPPNPTPQFVLLVHDFVAEKEGRARQMMSTMGLRWGSAGGC
jgi:hypothetical protein